LSRRESKDRYHWQGSYLKKGLNGFGFKARNKISFRAQLRGVKARNFLKKGKRYGPKGLSFP